jgi:Na+-transporting methylmalonyl-CoA/oxaloacetate decarboxylase beta subunit
MDFGQIFQGIGTMFAQSPSIVVLRIILIFVGLLLVYFGKKEVLEPLIMIPMGLGMSAVNAGMLFMDNGAVGNLILNPLLTNDG